MTALVAAIIAGAALACFVLACLCRRKLAVEDENAYRLAHDSKGPTVNRNRLLLLRRTRKSRADARSRQIADVLPLAAEMLRGGSSPENAFATVAASANWPPRRRAPASCSRSFVSKPDACTSARFAGAKNSRPRPRPACKRRGSPKGGRRKPRRHPGLPGRKRAKALGNERAFGRYHLVSPHVCGACRVDAPCDARAAFDCKPRLSGGLLGKRALGAHPSRGRRAGHKRACLDQTSVSA